MNCALCKKSIPKYTHELNNLKIDEDHSVDICQDCADKFMKWQQSIYAKLFPTNLAKKRFGKN